jgi:UDP-glucose 4-epimerase
VYNVACGSRTSLLQLVAKINALLGTNLQPTHEKPRPGDVKHSQADITPAKTELGYVPKFDIDQGLRKCLEYFRAQKK